MHVVFLAETNKYLFGRVYQSFESSGLTPVVLVILLITLACIFLAVLLYWILKVYRARHGEEKRYFGEITDKKTVYSIIDQAMLQRSKVVSRFSKKNKPFDCSIYQIEEKEIILEPPYYAQPTSKWLKKNLECTFRVGLDKENFLFYTFVSPINDFEVVHEVRMLRIDFPRSLFLGQKRRHLRLEPPNKWILGLALWPTDFLEKNGDREQIDKWGDPFIRMKKGEEKQPVLSLVDISAGGFRLRVSKEFSSLLQRLQRESPSVIVYIALGNGNGDTRRFLLLGRIKYSYIEHDQNFFYLSMEFVKYGRLREKGSREVIWEDINPAQGVEELGNWVFKRHLQLYREKGLG